MLSEITIMGKSIETYWIMFLIGVAVMMAENYRRRRLAGLGKPSALILGMYLALCGLIGAKLMYIAENLRHTLENGITFGGLSFFGTVFFMPIGLAAFAGITKKKKTVILDFCVVPIITMLAVMRVGCFLSGCCGGIAVDIFSMHIESLPTQLIEMVVDIAILFIILKAEKQKKFSGCLYSMFMVMYGICRFAVEFLRTREIRFGMFSNGHIFAVVSIVIGISVLYVHKLLKKE